MELEFGEVYRIRGYATPLFFAISEKTLVTKLPEVFELAYLPHHAFTFIQMPDASMLDLMEDWQVTSSEFDSLVGAIMRFAYRTRAKETAAAITYPYIEDPSILLRQAELMESEKPVTKEERVLKGIRLGKSAREIAKEIGLSKTTVIKIAEKQGLNFTDLRKQMHQRIIRNRKRGMSIAQLAKRYGFSKKQIIRICQKHGLKIKENLETKRSQRDEDILKELREGQSKESVAEKFELSSERIRKLANKKGLSVSPVESRREKTRQEIREALEKQEPVKAIARRLGVDRTTVQRIKRSLTQQNPVEPLGDSYSEDPAFMTLSEYLETQNPEGKYHPEGTFEHSLADLNKNYKLHYVGEHRLERDRNFKFFKSDNNYIITYGDSENFKDVAVVFNKILYYSDTVITQYPFGYTDDLSREWVPIEVSNTKRVKYLQKYSDKINDVTQENLQRYPYIYQRIRVGDQPYQIRFEKEPRVNTGVTVVILNQKNQVVARASDEWGATLLVVAAEYQKRGFGKILKRIWTEWNPEFKSGGFTSLGEANAAAFWAERVREFLARGWYSDLIRKGLLTKDRYRDIVASLPLSKSPTSIISDTYIRKEPVIYIEKDQGMWGPTFAIYDKKFLDDPKEEYIYGFGFFRDNPHVGVFLYTIDYEDEFRKLTTFLSLQIAKNNKEKIYIGHGYGDCLELEDIHNISISGDYVELKQDVLDLELLSKLDRTLRQKYDSDRQLFHTLLEMAHAKWL